MKFYAQLLKREEQADGTIKVWGIASTEALDSQDEMVAAGAMERALPDYMKFGAVREMHQPMAAGTAIEATVREDGTTWFGAHIVDPVACKKIRHEVYKGFSIGGKVLARDPMDRRRITEIELVEISLVDRPANPEAVFEMWKGSAMAKDNKDKKPEGDYGTHEEAGYADPGHQKDKKPRYPLKKDGELNEERIRAAWNYISKEKNAEEYSAEDLKEIKARIIAAWKKKIDKEGPPSAEEGDKADAKKADGAEDGTPVSEGDKKENEGLEDQKHPDIKDEGADGENSKEPHATQGAPDKTAKADVQKGMMELACLADVLSQIHYLMNAAVWEALVEQDGSAIPEKLKAWLADGATLLVQMAQEETGELTGKDGNVDVLALAARLEGISKAGQRHSKKDMDRVQKMHDMSCELGAKCDGDMAGGDDKDGEETKKSAAAALIKAETLAKSLIDEQTAHAETKADLSKVKSHRDELADKLTAIENQPEAPRGALRAIEKSHDVSGDAKVLPINDPALDNADPETVARAVLKSQYASGLGKFRV